MLAACVAMMIPKGNIISTPVSLLEKRCVTVSKEIIRAPYFLLSFGVTERNGFHFHLFASWERNCHRLEESMCFGSEISFWFGCAFLSSHFLTICSLHRGWMQEEQNRGGGCIVLVELSPSLSSL